LRSQENIMHHAGSWISDERKSSRSRLTQQDF
jgi:hypothetical protein